MSKALKIRKPKPRSKTDHQCPKCGCKLWIRGGKAFCSYGCRLN